MYNATGFSEHYLKSEKNIVFLTVLNGGFSADITQKKKGSVCKLYRLILEKSYGSDVFNFKDQ